MSVLFSGGALWHGRCGGDEESLVFFNIFAQVPRFFLLNTYEIVEVLYTRHNKEPYTFFILSIDKRQTCTWYIFKVYREISTEYIWATYLHILLFPILDPRIPFYIKFSFEDWKFCKFFMYYSPIFTNTVIEFQQGEINCLRFFSQWTLELGLKLRSVQLQSPILSALPYKMSLKIGDWKPGLVLALPVMNCVMVGKALISYLVKEGLGDNSLPDLIVNCSIFS